jgi:type IV pilus assembly protein PilM
MSILNNISRLVKDPSPNYVFELSEAGVAFAQPGNGRPGAPGFAPFEPGTLLVSPVEDNIHKAEAATATLKYIAPLDGSRKRRRAALILPDYAARVSVLDFDSFPSPPEEQLSLIRFRLKKTLPFDIDSAAVSYFAQPAEKGATIEVVAVIVALEIIARYEALFRAMNFHAGEVTTSSLAALHLCSPATRADAVNVIAKLSGKTLSVMVLRGEILKLFRCVALEEVTEEQILAVLHPTLSYVEDELAAPAEKLTLCGFPSGALAGLRYEKDVLRSNFGVPGAFNAGLLGYLEGARN